MNTIDVGDRKQLFLDDRWFAAQRGMSLRVNPPVKHERVLVPETPWESMRIMGGTVMEDEGRYRMWYGAMAPKPPDADHPCKSRFVCYAESDDGLNWRRVNVDLFSWQGHDENNIVVPAAHGNVMKDPNGPDEQRYKGLFRLWETEMWPESRGTVAPHWEGDTFIPDDELEICTSPDGIHWHRSGTVSDYFHDTSNHMFWDQRIGAYVAYVRTHCRGRTVGRIQVDDALDTPWVALGNDREVTRRRFATAASCDESDPPDTDLYCPCVHQYPWADDAYFAFVNPYRHYPVADTSDTTLQGKDERGRYRNDGTLDIQLAVSRDGVFFTRPDRQPYVPLGMAGAWDGGQLYMGLGMLRVGDEVWMYYTGTSHTHGAYDAEEGRREGGIGRLVQRLDGFISADAAYEGADFTTPLLTFSGAHLRLNVDCSALGQVWVELRDEKNQPIPGHTLAESIDVDRNHIAAPVRWREREHAGELAGRPVRVHVKARASKLYAFQFSSDRDS